MLTEIFESVTYYIGKSQQENHAVIDLGGPTDLWFHLADMSSCHVVAILPPNISRKERGKIIRHGALLCKLHTAKTKSKSQVSVTYAPIASITKGQTPGSVIAPTAKKLQC